MKTKAGLGLVILGFAVSGAWPAWTKTRNQVPIDVPLTLQAGKTLTEDFRLNLDGLYRIEILADTNLPPETLQCLMGLQTDPARCNGMAPAIAANWILFRNGQEMRGGSSRDPHSAPAEMKTPTRVIGEFPGE